MFKELALLEVLDPHEGVAVVHVPTLMAVVELTPSGRGQMVTHNLYASNELEQIRQQVGSGEVVSSSEPGSTSRSIESPSAGPNLQSQIDELKAEISELKERLNQLESI